MAYADDIKVDLSKGKETCVDYTGVTYLGKSETRKERVFEIFHQDTYYGTIKIGCKEFEEDRKHNKKKISLYELLRNAAYVRFPGMTAYPARCFTITNPQPWGIIGNKTMSIERGGGDCTINYIH